MHKQYYWWLRLEVWFSGTVGWIAARYRDNDHFEELLGWDPKNEECPAFIRKTLGIKFV